MQELGAPQELGGGSNSSDGGRSRWQTYDDGGGCEVSGGDAYNRHTVVAAVVTAAAADIHN